MTDHYRTLGVAPTASDADVRRAYLSLARRLHPDFHQDADAATTASLQRRMQAVNQAWEVLGDADQRRHYDRAQRSQRTDPAAGGFRASEPSRSRSEVWDEVRSSEDIAVATDPIRARFVAGSVVGVGIAALLLLGWLLTGWSGFGALMFIVLLVSLFAFLAIPFSAVMRSYQAERRARDQ